MNIEQANSIPLTEILEKLGYPPVKHRGYDVWYSSPFRKEKTPSFHIHTKKNVWYDFGECKGGDVVSFARHYLMSHKEDHLELDALRWLDNIKPSCRIEFIPTEKPHAEVCALALQSVSSLRHVGLISYLQDRGIPEKLARKYLREAVVYNRNTGNMFYAIAFQNDEEGYELRNNLFKGCIAPKYITLIRGKKSPSPEVHIFEGFMDFLSALRHYNTDQFDGDAIILNSVNCLHLAFAYIKGYTYKTVYSWLDNDMTGQRATDILADFVTKEAGLFFRAMNRVYLPYVDVNEWYQQKLKLQRTFNLPKPEDE